MVSQMGPMGHLQNAASWFTSAKMQSYPAVSSPPFEIGLDGGEGELA
jgi:hypothetical protein